MDDINTIDDQLTTALRRVVREEVINVIHNEGLTEYELDDKIYHQAQAACESMLDDNLEDRIAEYLDSNIAELLEGKLTITIE